MAWKQFDLIEPSIERAKQLLFPFKFWAWFKIAIVFLLAGSMGSGNNFGNAIRVVDEFSKDGELLISFLAHYFFFSMTWPPKFSTSLIYEILEYRSNDLIRNCQLVSCRQILNLRKKMNSKHGANHEQF